MATATAVPVANAVEYFKSKLEWETTPHGLKPRIEKNEVVVLDVRAPEDFAKEHIPGAKNVPLAELAKNLAKLPKDKTLVTYCWSLTCFAAPKAALELAQKGFKVQELIGGIKEWKNSGFPVEGGK